MSKPVKRRLPKKIRIMPQGKSPQVLNQLAALTALAEQFVEAAISPEAIDAMQEDPTVKAMIRFADVVRGLQ